MDGKSVFFSNVPCSTLEETLLELFSECGSITQFRPLQRKRGGFRGMGIVTFHDSEEAQTAVDIIRDRDVDGQPIWVSRDMPEILSEEGPDYPRERRIHTNRVFFSNVPFHTTEEALRGLFERVGRIQTLLMCQNHYGGFRGMGVCVYHHPGEAQAAVEMLRDVDVDGRPIWIVEEPQDDSNKPSEANGVPRTDHRPAGTSQIGQMNRMAQPSQTGQMDHVSQLGQISQMPRVDQAPQMGHVGQIGQLPQLHHMAQAAPTYGAASPYGAAAYSSIPGQHGGYAPAQFQGVAPHYDSRPSDFYSNRRQGPPPSEPVQEPVEVFFSNISYTTTEETLRAVFSEAGTVVNLRLFRKYNTDESRGMGVCTFDDPESARWAAKNLRERLVDDRNMWVAVHTGRAKPGDALGQSAAPTGFGSRRVFFSNVPFDVNSDELREFFEEVGRVESIKLFEKDGRSRGIGICTFESPSMAAAAIRGLRDRNVGGRPIWIAEDEDRGAGRGILAGASSAAMSAPLPPLPPLPPAELQRGEFEADYSYGGSRRVFFSNVPFDVDVETLKEFFEEVGQVDHLRLFEKDGKSRGMGLCTFESASVASAAIRHLRDRDVGGRPIWIAADDDKMKGTGKGAPMYGQSPAYGAAPLSYGGVPSQQMQPMQPMHPMQLAQPTQPMQHMAPDPVGALPYAFPQSVPKTSDNRYQPYGP